MCNSNNGVKSKELVMFYFYESTCNSNSGSKSNLLCFIFMNRGHET
jgi:hypothetical protein